MTPPAPLEGRIVVDDLTKVFRGNVRAVDRLSFTVEPGSVTGFLGPNGAGKTTTLRMVLGLVRPTGGRATIGGQVVPAAATTRRAAVGAALESSSFHPARTARNHLRILCTVGGMPLARADEVLDLVGLRDAARRKVRGYSLGMRQRLAPGGRRCSATPRCWCSTNRPTASTPTASAGCAACCAISPTRAARCWCRATSSTRCRRSPTGW